MNEASADRGRGATTPRAIPKEGWLDILKRTYREVKDDRVSYIAAAVAFYAMLAIFPAIIGLVSLYGLFAGPAMLERHLQSLTVLPDAVRQILSAQLHAVVTTSSGALSTGLLLSILGTIWAASAGVRALMEAMNIAYDEPERRGFLKRRLVSLVLTLGGLVLVGLAVASLAIVPAILRVADVGGGETVLAIVRWPVLVVAVALSLAVLYRYGPARDDAKWRWVTPGSIFATIVWSIVSVGFSWYVSTFGKFNETYGALGGVIVLLVWFYLSAIAIIIGAELDAEIERQTAHDTTKGTPQPMGRRGAFAADTVGQSPA
jgi:membrane protein